MTPPSRRGGSTQTGSTMHLLQEAYSGHCFPGLSSVYGIFDGGVRADIIASIAPKDAQNENTKKEQNEKGGERRNKKNKGTKRRKRRRTRKRAERETNKLGKRVSTRKCVPVVVVPQYRLTFCPGGRWME